MNKHIANYSITFIKRFRVTLLILFATLLLGAISYSTLLQREGFPSVDIPIVVVSSDYPVGNIQEVNEMVTRPIEIAIGDIPEIENITSYTTPAGMTMIVELSEDSTSEEGRDLIKEEISNSNDINEDSNIEFMTFDASLINGEYDIAITLSGDKSINELQAKADEISEQLIKIPEVLNAESIKLVENKINPATGQEEKVQSAFNRVAVEGEDGLEFFNAVNIGIQKKGDSIDLVTLSAAVRDAITEMEESGDVDLSGYQFTYGLDFAEDVNNQIDDLQVNGLAGLFAVAVLLLLFINWRASLVGVIFIPTVMAGTFIILYLIGYSLNVVSLFSLILVLGLFVDDAIVVTEAIDYQKQQGLKGIRAVREALMNVGVADISGTLTTILVFAPMIFISGILGEFIRIIPVTVVTALLVSLVTALTIVPFIANKVIRKRTNKTLEALYTSFYFFVVLAVFLALNNNENTLIIFGVAIMVYLFLLLGITVAQDIKKENRNISYSEKMINAVRFVAYAPGELISYFARTASFLVRVSFNGKKRTIISSIIILFTTIFLVGGSLKVAQSLDFAIFAPPKDSEEVVVNVVTRFDKLYQPEVLPTLSTEEKVKKTEEIVKKIENDIIEKYEDEIVNIYYSSGTEENAQFFIQLTPIGSRDTSAKEFVSEFNETFSSLQDADVNLEVSSAGPPEEGYPFAVQIFSEDEATLKSAMSDMQQFLANLELSESESVTEVKPDPLFTLTKKDGKRFVEIRAQISNNDDVTALLSEIKEKVEQEYDEEKLDTLSLNNESLEFDFGQESENSESFNSTFVALAIALILMYGLLVVQFNSFLQPLLIFIAIPLSFPGLFPGLAITNNPLSFFVMIGIIGLTGIVVNNTIMLVDFANQEKAKGSNSIDAISEAVKRRFRPVITTSATTIAGLLPLGLANPFWEGLAFSIVFGILSSAILIMFLFPAFYIWVEGIRATHKRRIIFMFIILALFSGFMIFGGL